MSICIIIAVLSNVLIPFIRKKKKSTFLFVMLTVLMIMYIYPVLDLTILSRTEDPTLKARIVPFSSFFSMFRTAWLGSGEYIAAGILGNTLLLAPFAMYVTNFLRIPRMRLIAGITGFFISLGIESIQCFYNLGVFETDDLICNTWGCVMGVCAVRVMIELADNRSIHWKNQIKELLPLIIYGILFFIASMVSLVRCI